MDISNLVNKEDLESIDSSEFTETTASPGELKPYSHDLEEVYLRIRDGNPPTKILNQLIVQHPTIPSIIYLRSWFFNRHAKYKRHINHKRLRLLKELNQFKHSRINFKGTKIDLTRLNPQEIHKYTQMIVEMQNMCAKYISYVHKMNDK
eukprot:NODE_1033_length_2526_cov_1.012361.p3 type:complete len:149 gc:universal NODE_1033_length_2526_cov_1.012361:561-115(-)